VKIIESAAKNFGKNKLSSQRIFLRIRKEFEFGRDFEFRNFKSGKRISSAREKIFVLNSPALVLELIAAMNLDFSGTFGFLSG
jgi:hypothetical protein